MPEKHPNADIRQLRTQAKEHLMTLPAEAKLADAQREIARENGYPSWPKLVDALETPVLIERLKRLVEAGDALALDGLLSRRPSLRKRLNEPIFGFDSPPVVRAAGHPQATRLLPVLVRNGADPNVRTSWWAGGFSALDSAKGGAVDVLLSLGARWDVWSAAGHGRVDVLRALLDAAPSLVSAPGGDGETPLHVASTPEVAELLIARGADLERRDVDHESTPAQYGIGNEPVLRVLLAHGARADAFVAAVLDDVNLLDAVLRDDPEAAMARVGEPPFRTEKSEGGHIYDYRLGRGKTPQSAAAEKGSLRVLRALEGRSPARDLIAAAWLLDEAKVRQLFPVELAPEDHGTLARAAQDGRAETVRLLLLAGLDPLATGMDSGTSLHVACWFGWKEVVRLLIPHVPLETRDAHHGSSPLGWALHGARGCRNAKGDYPEVVEALLAAGADPKVAANSEGTSMLDQAGDREDVKAVLRQYLD